MKKNLSILVIFLISLFVEAKDVRAEEGPVMLVECPVNTDNDGSEKDTTWTFFRTEAPRSNWVFYNGIGNFYDMDWCWFENYDDMKSGNSCDKSSNFGETGVNDNLTVGNCPNGHRKSKESSNRVSGGISVQQPIKVYSLDAPQYLVFKNVFGDIMIEYYDRNGFYRNILDGNEVTDIKDVLKFQKKIIKDDGVKEFFILNHDYSKGPVTSYLIYSSGGNADNNIQFLFGSNDNSYLLSLLKEWQQDNIDKLKGQESSYNKFKNDNKDLIKSCEIFNKEMDNNKKISDTKKFIYDEIINDLSDASMKLDAFDINDNSFSMCTNANTGNPLNSILNCVLSRVTGEAFKEANDYGGYQLNYRIDTNNGRAYGSLDYFDKGYFINLIYQDINKLVKENNLDINITASTDINSDIETLTKCISYLDENSNELKLDSNTTFDLRSKYEAIADKRGINVVIGCKGLLGKELIDKINSYLNIIKIAIPIILIAFGVFDFSKATFAGSEDNMKKAQQDFIKRLGIAILIFFVPIIVNFILNIANEVWSFISPDTCGLF